MDPYMGNQVANPIIITNNINPVKTIDDNRRFIIIEVSNCKMNSIKCFELLLKETKENIEYICHYFYNLDYEDDLNSIHPTTEAEKDLLDLNSSKEDKFIKEEMYLTGVETNDSR